MSKSVRPHRRQPTRLPRPWDSPGKNTGVGCHFLLQCMKVKSESEVTQSCPTLSDPMDCSLPGSSVHGIFQARVLYQEFCAIVMLFLLSELLFLSRLCNPLYNSTSSLNSSILMSLLSLSSSFTYFVCLSCFTCFVSHLTLFKYYLML